MHTFFSIGWDGLFYLSFLHIDTVVTFEWFGNGKSKGKNSQIWFKRLIQIPYRNEAFSIVMIVRRMPTVNVALKGTPLFLITCLVGEYLLWGERASVKSLCTCYRYEQIKCFLKVILDSKDSSKDCYWLIVFCCNKQIIFMVYLWSVKKSQIFIPQEWKGP